MPDLQEQVNLLRNRVDRFIENTNTTKRDLAKVFTHILDRLDKIDNRNPPASTPNKTTEDVANPAEKLDWVHAAIATVFIHPDWSDAAVARSVRVHPATLSRNETYRKAAGLARG